ncbi:restriction endonuclease subunit S [Barnesiella intestinihominis]|uniref:restriction endonuclease subunit S n=1 Tax=Barnesiella intestinihominis TaxID=487174 RepID=UPI003FED4D86
MNGKQLKNSILQWAIQGKLVPQDPNDEPASVLLERIRVEKAKLVKEKKIKKDKNESIIYRGDDNSYYEKFLATGEVKCIDDEIPFDIPQGWEWCRLKHMCSMQAGKNISASEIYDEKSVLHPYRCVGGNGLRGFTNTFNAEGHFAIIGRQGALCGCLNIESGKFYATEHAVVVNGFGIISSLFIYYFFTALNLNQYATATAQPGLAVSNIAEVFIPLPPLPEQLRIVSKIEKLLPLVKTYKQAQNELNTLNATLNEQLRKSILQEAIQGKLVPQIAEEGTAEKLLAEIRKEKESLVKEGKLKKSTLSDSIIYKGADNKYFEKIGNTEMDITDEIPFEIPDSWSWVRLNDICSYIQRGKSPKYSLIKKYPVVAQKCNQWSGFSIDKAQFIDPDTLSSYGEERILRDGDLMWNSTGLGTLGRMAIYWSSLNPYELAVADSHVTVIRAMKKFVMPQYLYYYFTSNTVQSVIEDKSDGSTKQKELATATVKTYLVPIPPLMEQDRIISKIKQLASIMSR